MYNMCYKNGKEKYTASLAYSKSLSWLILWFFVNSLKILLIIFFLNYGTVKENK